MRDAGRIADAANERALAVKIAITSIQRNRNPYIVEWIAFHLAMGFNQFYLYCHKTDDGMTETLLRLSKRYPIEVIALELDDFPQIYAYRHAWQHYGHGVDWMAFIDGDEFLFPTQQRSMQEALRAYDSQPISALGVFWKCYGSDGHVAEPDGLILENFTRHSAHDFEPNRHIKSIVKGGAKVEFERSHLFRTELGTFDEHLRPISHGLTGYEPTYDVFRINHYVVQSREFFRNVKKSMGAADLPAGVERVDAWFDAHDRNDENDGVAALLLPRMKEKLMELEQYLGAPTAPAADRGQLRQIVDNYRIAAEIPPGDYHFTGNSVGLKDIVGHIFPDKTRPVSILDIGFGMGDLGRIVKTNPATSHWHVDGIDGFVDVCSNVELFQQGIYRNVWHGLALDIPPDALRSYDVICLFDVIEHLEPELAKKLLADLLDALAPGALLVLSTPLWFWPQSQQNPGDLEEHKIAIPARSLLLLAPVMYHIHEKYLVGTFVFSKKSIEHLDHFVPLTDQNFNFDAGLRHLEALGAKADGVLYFVQQ